MWDILTSPTDWMPMPVIICWSEKESRSFRGIGALVDFLRLRIIIMALRRRERKFVIMKDRRTYGGGGLV